VFTNGPHCDLKANTPSDTISFGGVAVGWPSTCRTAAGSLPPIAGAATECNGAPIFITGGSSGGSNGGSSFDASVPANAAGITFGLVVPILIIVALLIWFFAMQSKWSTEPGETWQRLKAAILLKVLLAIGVALLIAFAIFLLMAIVFISAQYAIWGVPNGCPATYDGQGCVQSSCTGTDGNNYPCTCGTECVQELSDPQALAAFWACIVIAALCCYIGITLVIVFQRRRRAAKQSPSVAVVNAPPGQSVAIVSLEFVAAPAAPPVAASVVVAAAATGDAFCPNCGMKRLSSDDRFCGECGGQV